MLPELGRPDGLEAVPVRKVRLQVRPVHVDDVHASLVDLEVLLKLRWNVDDHLEAIVEDTLEALVVLRHGALEAARLLVSTL